MQWWASARWNPLQQPRGASHTSSLKTAYWITWHIFKNAKLFWSAPWCQSMAQVCPSSVKTGLSCSYPKVCPVSISSFGSARAQQCWKSHQPRPSHTSMEFHRKNPQALCFQLGNWDCNPSSFPTAHKHTGSLPQQPLALGSAPSMYQGRQRGLHKLCAQCETGMILFTNKLLFPPPTSARAEAAFSPTHSVLLVNIITPQKSYLRYGRTNIVSGLRGSQIWAHQINIILLRIQPSLKFWCRKQ